MELANLIVQAKAAKWGGINMSDVGDVPTMLKPGERKVLHYFAKNMDFKGCIVDAGAFCGGSTISLASGLSKNPTKAVMHTYDMFIAPNDSFSLGLIGHNCKPGDNILNIVRGNLGEYINLVNFHQGDFLNVEPPNQEIDLLFVDLAKTWELNQVVQSKYFSLLEPGRSIVIQQDLNFHGAPWVNILMQYYSEYFERILDVASSRVFLYRKKAPDDVLAFDLRTLPIDKKLELIELSALESPYEASRFSCREGKAWILFQERGLEEACSYLDEIRDLQPWSGEPHTEVLKKAFRMLGDLDGYKSYFANYFPKKNTQEAAF